VLLKFSGKREDLTLVRRDLRSSSLGYERRLATTSKRGDVAVHPGPRATGRARHLAHRTSFDEHRLHCIEGQIHRDTSALEGGGQAPLPATPRLA